MKLIKVAIAGISLVSLLPEVSFSAVGDTDRIEFVDDTIKMSETNTNSPVYFMAKLRFDNTLVTECILAAFEVAIAEDALINKSGKNIGNTSVVYPEFILPGNQQWHSFVFYSNDTGDYIDIRFNRLTDSDSIYTIRLPKNNPSAADSKKYAFLAGILIELMRSDFSAVSEINGGGIYNPYTPKYYTFISFYNASNDTPLIKGKYNISDVNIIIQRDIGI
jgi:hypothetical protein